jgi:hypothetical protein
LTVFRLYQPNLTERAIPPNELLRRTEKVSCFFECIESQKEIWFFQFHRSNSLILAWASRIAMSGIMLRTIEFFITASPSGS